ncbi:hypothetical protein KR038_008416, partial [Drosophila bunnanda]
KMDIFCKIALLTLVMASLKLAQGASENSQLRFLNKLVKRINGERLIKTVLLLQHHQNENCILYEWNQPDIPFLRTSEIIQIDVRRHFNNEAVAIVCLSSDSDTSLLDTVANNFNGMRQARILLLTQIDMTEELLQKILNKVAEYQFLRMLILEVGEQQTTSVLRLDLFPHPHFDRVDNILTIKERIFCAPELNFKGRTTYVLPKWKSALKYYKKLPSNDSMPLNRIQDIAIVHFALKYNVSLRVLNSSCTSVTPDIRLRTQMQLNMTNIRTVSPYDISSLKVIVPCAREWSIGEAFLRIDIKSWLVHIVVVYVLFVATETFILVVTYRISGQAYRLTVLNPLVNLRAIRAILGMPFPISRRSSLSLRQLSLAISIFGLIFSNFFSCKLSALLTKHPHHANVDNFEELQACGLPVIATTTYRRFIKSDLGVKLNLTKIEYVSQEVQDKMLLALNFSNAYFMFSYHWEAFDNYQKTFGRRTMCNSANLTFIQGLPMMYELRSNSIFARPLVRYLVRLNEAGIINHWIANSTYHLRTEFKHLISQKDKRKHKRLSIGHLKWVWCVLGCGHGLALVAFIIEFLLGGRKERSSRPSAHV